MRLKCIKLAGFKSFVDPTTVPFPSNLCAVVGPNGCGKSNIIDAVRWVMGESSAKHLRGEAMTDVIFNGSNARKPVGQASIELVFDNSDGSLGGQYAQFSEISIKRRVSRDGQSTYFLNGAKCRRRDITDIFLGTGLGPRSYAIIEQGMISRLIEAKPEELRVYIEEAAGISKYKERRRETENRMRRTQENLERLTDLREELERQLQHLHRQAQAAQCYTELKQEERQLKAQLHALRWKQVDDNLQQQVERVRELELMVERLITEQRRCETELEQQRQVHQERSDTFNEVQARFYELGAEIARAEQTLEHHRQRGQQLRNDLQQADQGWQEARQELTQDQTLLEELQQELLELEPELALTEEEDDSLSESLALAEERMQDWQQRWDQFTQQSQDAQRRAEVEQSRIQQTEKNLQSLQQRMERLRQESSNLLDASAEDEIALLKEQLAEQELAEEEQQGHVEQQKERIEGYRRQVDEATARLDQARGLLQQLRGKQTSLETLQQAALAQDDESLQAWLAQQGLQQQPPLAQRISVTPGWETALETVLGADLQALCVESLNAEQLESWLQDLPQSSLSLIDVRQANRRDTSSNSLADRVQGPAAVTAWLAPVKTADTLAQAVQLRAGLEPGESVITPDGVWLGPGWVRLRQPADQQSGVLQRQQALDELTAQLEQVENQAETAQQELEQARAQQREAESILEQQQREQATAQRRISELQADLRARQARAEQLAMRHKRTQEELEELTRLISEEQEALAQSRLVWQDAMTAMEANAEEREQLESERESNRSQLEQARQSARTKRDLAHQMAMRKQTLETRRSSTQQALERAQIQVERLSERRELLQQSLEETLEPVEELQLELESLLERRLQEEETLNQQRQQLDAADQQMRELEQRRSKAEQALGGIRTQLEQARMEQQALEIRRTNLQEQLQEMEFQLKGVLEILPEEATEPAWEEELTRIGNRIQRLGAINLAAIEEYKTQSERKEYLDAQNADLEEALETLENAIRRIDRETRARFKETYERVNEGLQHLFPKVFGGGLAWLELTGDDLLDTGVAIMARPPGKRNSTIHLLSGGEKALTAIALVFSIFQLNPAPFCMLDEVDAPLDDANVGRYARLVSEMSDQVQFIYITHNKIAMEMAIQLMGVTMHEPGVSRIVSVDVEEAAALAAV